MVHVECHPINRYTLFQGEVPKLLGNTVPATKMSNARNWTFTLNNPTDEEQKHILDEVSKKCDFIVFQKEKGVNNTEHLQGYIQLGQRKRLSYVRELLGPRGHYECARGTATANVNYCTKTEGRIEGPWSLGAPVSQGQRSDLQEFVSFVREHRDHAQIIDMFPAEWVKYNKSVDRLFLIYAKKRDWQMNVVVYWGPSGSGKTRKAYESDLPENIYMLSKGDSNQSVWWDGYNGQPTIIIDDFYGWLPWTFMLRLLDRYPFQVQPKGSSLEFVSKNIYITSNQHPNEWYKNIPNNDITPLIRRINEIMKIDTINSLVNN